MENFWITTRNRIPPATDKQSFLRFYTSILRTFHEPVSKILKFHCKSLLPKEIEEWKKIGGNWRWIISSKILLEFNIFELLRLNSSRGSKYFNQIEKKHISNHKKNNRNQFAVNISVRRRISCRAASIAYFRFFSSSFYVWQCARYILYPFYLFSKKKCR